jgi:hypothetical protein
VVALQTLLGGAVAGICSTFGAILMLLEAQMLGQFGVERRLNSQFGENFCKIIQVMLSFKPFGKLIGQFL